jgi:hypothetical protein
MNGVNEMLIVKTNKNEDNRKCHLFFNCNCLPSIVVVRDFPENNWLTADKTLHSINNNKKKQTRTDFLMYIPVSISFLHFYNTEMNAIETMVCF